jgi:hypothetical protein
MRRSVPENDTMSWVVQSARNARCLVPSRARSRLASESAATATFGYWSCTSLR